MTVVNHTLVNEAGQPIAGTYVEVRLLAPTEDSNAYQGSNQVISRIVTRTDSGGTWTLDLIPNSDITPSGSAYEVEHHIVGWPTQTATFAVPSSGPVNLVDILTDPPAPLPPPGTLVHTVEVAGDQIANLTAEPILVFSAPGPGKYIDLISVMTEVQIVNVSWPGSVGSGVGVCLHYIDGSPPTANQNIGLAGGVLGFLLYANTTPGTRGYFNEIGYGLLTLKQFTSYIVDLNHVENTAIELIHTWGIANPPQAGPITVGPIFTVDPTPAVPGTGYAPGDTGLLPGGNGDATYIVDTVDGGGGVLTFHIDSHGTGYTSLSDSNPWATSVTTGGGDAAFAINITDIGPKLSRAKLTITYQIVDLLPAVIE